MAPDDLRDIRLGDGDLDHRGVLAVDDLEAHGVFVIDDGEHEVLDQIGDAIGELGLGRDGSRLLLGHDAYSSVDSAASASAASAAFAASASLASCFLDFLTSV